jgi:hypothetical protein
MTNSFLHQLCKVTSVGVRLFPTTPRKAVLAACEEVVVSRYHTTVHICCCIVPVRALLAKVVRWSELGVVLILSRPAVTPTTGTYM